MTASLLRLVAAWLALATVAGSNAHAGRSLLDDQRAIFRNAWASAERGDWVLSRNEQALLEPYVLWPVLRGRYLEAAMEKVSGSDIERFLNRHGTSRPARSLRFRYARYLARNGHNEAYLDIYARYYRTLGNAELDCRAVAAEIAANKPINGALALSLWRIGKSQHKACDPVFAWLADNDILGASERRERFELALAARELGLARWLAKKLSPVEQATAARWVALRDKPRQALADESRRTQPGFADEIAYGVARLARDDTTDAMAVWDTLRQRHAIPAELAARTTERIALIAAWRHEPHAAAFLARVPAEYASLELAEWRVRTALRAGDDKALLAALDALPAAEQAKPRWRYWRAHALAASAPDTATAILAEVAAERSYYGFLAADRLGQPYALKSHLPAADDATLTALRARPDVARALELHAVDLPGRARSEWDRAMRELSQDERRQAALLAASVGWHSRAISALASAGEFDVLELRYPTPWLAAFREAARQNDLPLAWTYGIARSESLFMADVRSPAGAVGIMQLMPRTGKQTARAAGLPYRGLATLTHAASNIRIGTRYLAELATRFAGHEALATAAYNAGPHRVDRWLEGAAGMPADVWVETIPFDETRGYVQRVIAARAVFHWRLTAAERPVSHSLPPIPAGARKVAATAR